MKLRYRIKQLTKEDPDLYIRIAYLYPRGFYHKYISMRSCSWRYLACHWRYLSYSYIETRKIKELAWFFEDPDASEVRMLLNRAEDERVYITPNDILNSTIINERFSDKGYYTMQGIWHPVPVLHVHSRIKYSDRLRVRPEDRR